MQPAILDMRPLLTTRKILFFAGSVVFILLIFALNSNSTLQDKSANKLNAVGALTPVSDRPADSPSSFSPFGALTCVSSDCAPISNEAAFAVENEDLPPQTMIYSYLEKISKGDSTALAAAGEVLNRCLESHRNRLVTNKAFGIAVSATRDECGVSELADLVAMTESAVGKGFNAASLRDSNSKMARLGWITTLALLDDTNRQLAFLPKLQPNSDSAVVFDEIPLPKRQSPIWKKVSMFAKDHGPSDPEIQRMAEGLAASEEDSSPIVEKL